MRKVALLLFLIGLYLNNYASHIPGGNISYECVSTNPLTLKLKGHIYVACASIGMPSMNFQVSNNCGFTNPSISGSILTDTSQVTWLCPSVISTCDGGTIQEWEKYNFEATVILPDTCNSWKFSWTHCCRPASSNLSTIGDVYLETTINTTQINCDISPQVQGQEIPFYCAGQTNNYCIPAYDLEGDSLYYELTDAKMAGGTPIPYSTPYSATQPLQNVIFNGNTGCFSFNQPTAGMFHVAVKIHSYKNGSYIGYVTHDFPVNVIACSNNAPVGAISNVTGISALQTDQNSIEVCVNDPFCFDISFIDPNPSDSIWYDSLLSNLSLAYPGAIISNTGQNPLTLGVCWTASNLGYYYATSFVNDNYCPLQGVGSFTSIVNSIACSPTAIKTDAQFERLSIYPNPKSNHQALTIKIKSLKNEEVTILILDILGKNVFELNKILHTGINTITINEKLPQGVLMINLKTKDKNITKKIVIQ